MIVLSPSPQEIAPVLKYKHVRQEAHQRVGADIARKGHVIHDNLLPYLVAGLAFAAMLSTLILTLSIPVSSIVFSLAQKVFQQNPF